VRRYTDEEELRMRLQRSVKDWTRSGLLRPDQGAQLEADLRVDLRRTGIMLRLGLALFTTILAGATVLLTWVSLGISGDSATGILILIMGAICFWAADRVVAGFRLYRYGVEEALVVASVGLCGVGVALIANTLFRLHDSTAIALSLAAAAAVSGYSYHRFGLWYAGVAAIVCAALIPFSFDGVSEPVRRLLVALMFGGAVAGSTVMATGSLNEVRKEDAFTLRAAALVGLYLAINLQITGVPFAGYGRAVDGWFKWTTYALIWIVPALALWSGTTGRDRKLMLAGLATALATLVTNKPYLGLPRQTWDPMLFGLLLMAVALILRRWLASGPNGERRGFTAARIVHSDVDAMRLASLASVAIHLDTDRPAPSPPPPEFGGGRSGGGGAGADF